MGIQERRIREREARRASVLDAARELLCEHGFSGTTTKQIAERCEVSEATLFWHFQSKDEIFVSLLFEGIEFMARGLEEIGVVEAPLEKRFTQLWKFFTRVRDEHPEYFYVFAYLAHPQSTASVADEVKADLARRSGNNFRMLANIIAESTDVKNARPIVDLLWSAFLGLMVLRDSRANLGATPRPNEKELKALCKLLIEGIVPQEA